MVPHSPEITPATPADVPLLLELIRELAEFEQLLHAVDATADSLGEALFGAKVGHVVKYLAPGGESSVEVVSIEA